MTTTYERIQEIKALQADLRAHPYREDCGQADQLDTELAALESEVETAHATYCEGDEPHTINQCPDIGYDAEGIFFKDPPPASHKTVVMIDRWMA